MSSVASISINSFSLSSSMQSSAFRVAAFLQRSSSGLSNSAYCSHMLLIKSALNPKRLIACPSTISQYLGSRAFRASSWPILPTTCPVSSSTRMARWRYLVASNSSWADSRASTAASSEAPMGIVAYSDNGTTRSFTEIVFMDALLLAVVYQMQGTVP